MADVSPTSVTQQVSLTSTWFMRPGCAETALPALRALARAVESDEPGTLTYLVHFPSSDPSLQSLPPAEPRSVVFFEVYRDADAFRDHVRGPLFTNFVSEFWPMFVTNSKGRPCTATGFLHARAEFSRPPGRGDQPTVATPIGNHHLSVMFRSDGARPIGVLEVLPACFSWSYQTGSRGYRYVRFPSTNPPLLGGIGQSEPNVPRMEPGCVFYVMVVQALQPVIDAAISAGGSSLTPPTEVDGYHFAMVEDPDGNPIGLVEPFTD